MFRADGQGNEQAVAIPTMGGGLDTLSPAHKVTPDKSPDLLNVVINQGAITHRGGFIPKIRQMPKVCALRNRGYSTIGRENPVSAVNTTYKTVVGAAHAGHRACWDDAEIRNAITIDFFCVIDDLTTSHGGNGTAAATNPFSPSPFTVKVRPILSKGPIKRFADTAQVGHPHNTGAIAWQASVAALPFVVYLWNNAGTWEFAMSFHYQEGGNWQIRTITTPIAALGGVRINTTYQVTCGYDVSANTCFLRVGGRFDTGAPSYVTVTSVVGAGAQTAIPTLTKTPIQVFDCPQGFIEQAAAPHPTTPPGLGLGGIADGGYWFGSLRFEGSIEDIVIYRSLVANASTGALDRTGRIDPSNPPAERLQHWPVDGDTNVIEERSGVGNHLYRVPSGPIFDEVSGGIGGGSLVFDGANSYALMEVSDIGRYSWRLKSDGTNIGTMWTALAYNWGIEVSCWPESIEPNFEQVIAELHSTLRVVITTTGLIRVYVRHNTITTLAPVYQTAVTSTRAIIPGQRYHIIVMVNAGASVDLVINGRRDSAPAIANYSSTWPTSGLTVGMGSFRGTAVSTAGAIEGITAGPDQINTDSRSAFFGRIETVRILLGEYPFETPVPGFGGEVPSQHRGMVGDDYAVKMRKHFDTPASFAGLRDDINPWMDDGDALANISTGAAVVAAQLRSAAGELHTSAVTNPTSVTYFVTRIPGRSQQGVYHLYASVGVRKVLGAWDFSEPVIAPGQGAYSQSVEGVYAPGWEPNGEKLVWWQRPYVDDLMGVLGPVQLRCVESDVMKEFAGAATWGYQWQRRFKPYIHRSPAELAPAWAEGLIRANLGENPIAMISSLSEETTGETMEFALCRRSLYWVKRPYKAGSPFRSETDSESLWFFGARNDACRASGMTSHGSGATWAAHAAFLDFWIKPTRLDGKRLIACYGDNIGSTVRYMVWLDQGSLYVAGDHAGGWWCYFHGGLNGANLLRDAAIPLNKWSHIYVSIGSSTVTVRINGQIVTMTAHPSAAGIAAGNIPAATSLWLGGMDADQMSVIRSGSADFTFLLQPFHGQMTAIREKDSGDTTWWDAGESGVAPQARPSNDGNTRWLYQADEDTGWAIPSDTPGVPALEVKIRELIGIRHDLEDAGKTPLSAAAYRNELVFTQVRGYPQRISFTSFDDVSGPFRCVRLGMEAPNLPLATSYAPTIVLLNQSDTNAPTPFIPGDTRYEVYVSFLNALGEESEAELWAYANAHAVTSYGVLQLWDVPRGADPQVVARNIYLSINGATPLYVGTLLDNETRFYEIQARGTTIAAPTDGANLPAPAARRVAVGVGFIALTTLDGNGNSFAVSGNAASYFPLARLIVVDSENGEPVISAMSYLGTLYVFKRDGTWAFVTAGVQDVAFAAGLRPVNSSCAAAGGVAIYDNLIYGASDRGVWLFDGNNYAYVGSALEGEFPDARLDAEGLLAQQGVFLPSEGQYWLSVRQRGEDTNRILYVLHADEERAWTKVEAPEHVAMARVDDVVTRHTELVIGTAHGAILRYDPDASMDGVRDVDHHGGAQAIAGAILGSTTRTITIASGTLDVAYDGHRGAPLMFLDANGLVLAIRTIVSNTTTVVTFDEDYTVPAGATYAIGGVDAYWSSPWLAPQRMGSYLKSEEIDLEFEPSAASLRVENRAAMSATTDRAFDSSGAELRSVAMTLGYAAQPSHTRDSRHGRYFRMRFGTAGVRKPFSLTGYGFRFGEATTRGKPT